MPRLLSPPPGSTLAPVLALALALATGCGGDQAERDRFERAQAACATAVGLTLAEAGAAIGWQNFVLPGTCLAAGSPVGGADACPGAPGPYSEPVCEVGFEWCAAGTSLCGDLGCAYACLARVAAASPLDVGPGSTVCATRFVSGQPLGPVSRRSCR